MVRMGNALRAMKIATFVVLVINIAYAIVMPRFVTARMNANEAAAIADSRAVISVEITRLCREGPDCRGIGIPSYPDSQPSFLDPELARNSPYVKDGYLHEWIPHGDLSQVHEAISQHHRASGLEQAEALSTMRSVSPTSVLDYCYTSTPESLGRTGVRSFSATGPGAVYGDDMWHPMMETHRAAIPCPVPFAGDAERLE